MNVPAPRLACRGSRLACRGRTLCADLDLDVQRRRVLGDRRARTGAGKPTLLAALAGAPAARGRDCLRRHAAAGAAAARARAPRGWLPQDSIRLLSGDRAGGRAGRPASALARWQWETAADVERARARAGRRRPRRLRRAAGRLAVRRRAAPGRAGRAAGAGPRPAPARRAVVAPRPRPPDRRAGGDRAARPRARQGGRHGAARPPPRAALRRSRRRPRRRGRRRRSGRRHSRPPIHCRRCSAIAWWRWARAASAPSSPPDRVAGPGTDRLARAAPPGRGKSRIRVASSRRLVARCRAASSAAHSCSTPSRKRGPGAVQQVAVDDQQIALRHRRQRRPAPPLLEPVRAQAVVGRGDDDLGLRRQHRLDADRRRRQRRARRTRWCRRRPAAPAR